MNKIIGNDMACRTIFWNTNTSDVYKEGELLKRPKLGDTLERISLRGEAEFYEGETAKILIADVQAAGKSILNIAEEQWGCGHCNEVFMPRLPTSFYLFPFGSIWSKTVQMLSGSILCFPRHPSLLTYPSDTF